MAKLKIENKVYSANDCMMPPDATRIVRNNGSVTLFGRRYQHPALYRYAGQELMLFRLNSQTIGICIGSEFICAAVAEIQSPILRYRVGDTVYIRSLNKHGVVGDILPVMQTYIYRVKVHDTNKLSDFYAEQLSHELAGERS